QVSKEIRKAFRPRFQWRPYVLRAYFDTQLLIAESKGRIAHDFRVFFMGHKGSMEARYTTNKRMLPEMLSSEMRDAFVRSEEFLDLDVANAASGTAAQSQKKREEMHHVIHGMTQNATPDQLDSMLEALLLLKQRQGAGNIQGQEGSRRLLMQIQQSA
ncbi:MAG: hypothetical protein OXI27_04095, partial [Thaumarchaeota archaeon]|nr:hypothetical protein [Nitrososphaerota archaeon]